MDPAAASRLTRKGGSSHEFRARQLREEILVGVSFVLAMTEAHRAAIVAMSPKMLKRTYTIAEFAAVLDDLMGAPLTELPHGRTLESRVARWEMLRTLILLRRHSTRTRLSRISDIADPYMRGELAFDNMVTALDPLIASIVRFESLCMTPDTQP